MLRPIIHLQEMNKNPPAGHPHAHKQRRMHLAVASFFHYQLIKTVVLFRQVEGNCHFLHLLL